MDRDQPFLMPPSMADWLPEGHLAWFVLDVIEALDTSAWHAGRRLGGVGRQGYDPDMLLGLLVYAYALGERSSRQIERLCGCDVAFRVLCAQDAPDHSTLARFRAEHEQAFAGLFAQVLVMCAQAGMLRLGVVALDGTKIAANASMGANRTAEFLRAEAQRIVAEAGAVDADEGALFGDARGDELPEQWCGTDRRSRIMAALAQVRAEAERAQALSEAEAKTAAEYERRVQAGEAIGGKLPRGVDPIVVLRARRARAQRMYEQAGTTQLRCDAAKLIRRTERALAQAEADAHAQEPPAADVPVDEAEDVPGHVGSPQSTCASGSVPPAAPQPPEGPAAKAQQGGSDRGPAGKANTTDPDSRVMKTQQGWVQGYNAQIVVSQDHLILAVWLTQHTGDVQCFTAMMAAAMAAARTVQAHQPPAEHQQPDGGIGTILADAGYMSEANLTAPGPDRLIAVGKRRDLKQAAATHPASGPPPQGASPPEAMSHRLRTPEGSALYKRRGATVEPVNAHIKDQVGLRRFARRGLRAASSELNLAAAVVNLLKLRHRTAPATA